MSRHHKPAKPLGDYPVGYRRPPAEGRFQPGKSGNPGGRQKGQKSLGRLLTEALARWVTIQENGQQRRMRMQDVIIQGLVNDAARRDPRALKLLFGLMGRYGDGGEQGVDPQALLSQDRAIIEAFVASIKEPENVGELGTSGAEPQESEEPAEEVTMPDEKNRRD